MHRTTAPIYFVTVYNVKVVHKKSLHWEALWELLGSNQ